MGRPTRLDHEGHAFGPRRPRAFTPKPRGWTTKGASFHHEPTRSDHEAKARLHAVGPRRQGAAGREKRGPKAALASPAIASAGRSALVFLDPFLVLGHRDELAFEAQEVVGHALGVARGGEDG